MTFDKNDFLSLVKVTAEEVQPWSTNFEIINEVQFGNVTVIQLVKPRPDKGPPIFELIISKPLDLIDLLISSTKEFFTASGFIIQSVFSIF